MDSNEELFLRENCFLLEVLEPNFSMGQIFGEIGNDLESNPQNSFHEDLKKISCKEKIKKGQTDQLKTSAECRMIFVVELQLQKRKPSQIPQNTSCG